MITAIAGSAKDDDDRVTRGCALFEDLHKHYARDPKRAVQASGAVSGWGRR